MVSKIESLLLKVADERRVDSGSIPIYARDGMSFFADIYESLKRESEKACNDGLGPQPHRGFAQHALDRTLENTFRARDMSSQIIAANRLVENGNQPTKRTQLEKGIGWVYPSIQFSMKEDGSVTERYRAEKYPIIESVNCPTAYYSPEFVFIGKESAKGIEKFFKDFDIPATCTSYIGNRLEAYSRRDGKPKSGQEVRLKILEKIDQTFF